MSQMGVRRCDTLYELALIKNRELEVKRQLMQERQLEEELEQVTFRPVINHKQAYDYQVVDVAERNRVWLENKEKKIETLKA